MRHMIVARTDRPEQHTPDTGTPDGGTAVSAWAAEEAGLRGLPLRTVRVPPPDGWDGTGLVVVGIPEAEGAAGLAPGSTAAVALGTAPCPVALVPDRAVLPGPVRRAGPVVLGVDARRPARGAIEFAFGTARTRGVRLHAVHAWTLPPDADAFRFGIPEEDRAAWEDQEVQLLADVLRPWRAGRPEVRVTEDVRLLSPARALLHTAAGAGLLVVGRGSGRGPGGVLRALAARTMCPVVVVPG
ncbi:universal stress protein [Streptomyces sp. SID2888]|uniref:universal stress protein n=1 Tax=Streptomyces sp. SID2888 TaxID=2690256 RepID=UPI001F35CAAF|nr:universal stress protein [Streptomyces sp. SID2888]